MGERIRILVVDDDQDILFSMTKILRTAGYEVYEAESGTSCLRMVSEKNPDLILLDVVLPDISGYEICQLIKAEKRRRPTYVVLLSGIKTAPDDQSEGLEMGADGYLVRPISKRELLARVKAMERIIRAERERDELIEKLQKALAEIKTLKGFLPICSSCKKIRDDKGYWTQIEAYIRDHSEAEFTHGICPDCFKKLYPDEV